MSTTPSRHSPSGSGDVNSDDIPPNSLVGAPPRVGTDTASPSACNSPSAATTAGGASVPAAFAPGPKSALLPQRRGVEERSLTPVADFGRTFDRAAGTHANEIAADGHLGEQRSDAK